MSHIAGLILLLVLGAARLSAEDPAPPAPAPDNTLAMVAQTLKGTVQAIDNASLTLARLGADGQWFTSRYAINANTSFHPSVPAIGALVKVRVKAGLARWVRIIGVGYGTGGVGGGGDRGGRRHADGNGQGNQGNDQQKQQPGSNDPPQDQGANPPPPDSGRGGGDDRPKAGDEPATPPVAPPVPPSTEAAAPPTGPDANGAGLGGLGFTPSPEQPVGWRGDSSGCFPDAMPPLSWDGSANKNILWHRLMPHRSLAAPIVVGDRVIVLADPHTILGFDGITGRRLWYNAADHLDEVCGSAQEAAKIRQLWDQYHRFATSLGGVGQEVDPVAAAGERDVALAALRAAGVKLVDPGKERVQADHPAFFARYGLWSSDDPDVGATLATPVSDGTHVWALYASNDLWCYEVATGKSVWHRFFGPVEGQPPGGFLASPLLVDDVVVLEANGHLRGLDSPDGEVLWDIPCPGGRSDRGSPVMVILADRRLVVTRQGWVVEPLSGKVLTTDLGGVAPAGDPPPSANGVGLVSVLDGNVVVRSTAAGGIAAVRLAFADGVVTSEPLWILEPDRHGGTFTNNPLCFDGYLYPNDDRDLIAVATGKRVARTSADIVGGAVSVSLAGKNLYRFDTAGGCQITDPGPAGKVLAVNHLGDDRTRDPLWWKQVEVARTAGVIGWIGRRGSVGTGLAPAPFFHGNRIYLRTATQLVCIGEK